MSRFGAFVSGMGFPTRLNDREQERLLAGTSVQDRGEFDRVAVFMRAMAADVPEAPPEGLERSLAPRLAEAARTSAALAETPEPSRIPEHRPRSRFALVARVAVAVALVPVLMAGLAVAGVKVPTAAKDAFEGVGVELPNQNADDDSTPVTEPPGSDTAEDAGTDEGRGKKLGHAKSPAKGGTPPGKKRGHAKSPAKGGTPPGKARGQSDAGSSNAGGNSGGSGGGGGSSSSGQSGSVHGKSSAPGQTKVKPTPPARGKSK